MRAVEAGSSCRAAAGQFGVSVSFVVKLMRRWRERGSVAPDQYGGWRKPTLIPFEEKIRAILAEHAESTLETLRRELAMAGVDTSCPTLSRYLRSERFKGESESIDPSK